MAITVLPDKKAMTVTKWLIDTVQHYNCKFENITTISNALTTLQLAGGVSVLRNK